MEGLQVTDRLGVLELHPVGPGTLKITWGDGAHEYFERARLDAWGVVRLPRLSTDRAGETYTFGVDFPGEPFGALVFPSAVVPETPRLCPECGQPLPE